MNRRQFERAIWPPTQRRNNIARRRSGTSRPRRPSSTTLRRVTESDDDRQCRGGRRRGTYLGCFACKKRGADVIACHNDAVDPARHPARAGPTKQKKKRSSRLSLKNSAGMIRFASRIDRYAATPVASRGAPRRRRVAMIEAAGAEDRRNLARLTSPRTRASPLPSVRREIYEAITRPSPVKLIHPFEQLLFGGVTNGRG